MSRISEFFMRCIKQHTWIFIIFFIHVLLNIPILFHPYGYILTAQDYNPVHFVQMYWHNDIPAFDDSEVGENRSRLVFGTAYFWLPMLLAKLGIPLETTVIFHGLFGLPLLLASIYVISYTLFRNANLAGMTAAAFPLFHFSAFGVNLGYQILFQQTYYYNDFNLVFTGWALASAVGNRLVGAAAWCAVLVLFNPTAGINLVIVLFIFGLLTRWQTIVTGIIKHNIDLIMAAALVVAAITVSYVLLLFAAPSHPNAPREARDFAIQAYGHITPHIYDGILYLYAQLTLSILLVYAVWTEVRVGSIVGLSLAVAMMLALVVMGWFIYFLTIVLSPLLLVLLSPSKILIIAAIYTFIYAMHAAWRALGCHATVTVILVGGVFAAGRLGNIGLAEIPSIWLIEILFVAVALFCDTRVCFGFQGRMFGTALSGLVIALALLDSAQSTSWIADRRYFVSRDAFHDIQLKIRETIPPGAVFAPWRDRCTIENPYRIFRNWPFRTYSRRGAISWVVGRNAYWDSLRRHELEVQTYNAAGFALWEDLLEQSRKMKIDNPMMYYTGVRTDPNLSVGVSGIWSIYINKINEFINYVESMSFEHYLDFARRAGASYIIISRDPGRGTFPTGIVENEYFVVMAIPLTSSSP